MTSTKKTAVIGGALLALPLAAVLIANAKGRARPVSESLEAPIKPAPRAAPAPVANAVPARAPAAAPRKAATEQVARTGESVAFPKAPSEMAGGEQPGSRPADTDRPERPDPEASTTEHVLGR